MQGLGGFWEPKQPFTWIIKKDKPGKCWGKPLVDCEFHLDEEGNESILYCKCKVFVLEDGTSLCERINHKLATPTSQKKVIQSLHLHFLLPLSFISSAFGLFSSPLFRHEHRSGAALRFCSGFFCSSCMRRAITAMINHTATPCCAIQRQSCIWTKHSWIFTLVQKKLLCVLKQTEPCFLQGFF